MSKTGEFKTVKLLICNHFDQQIRDVDIYTEGILSQHNENEKIPDLHYAAAQTDFYGLDKRTTKKEPDADDDDDEDDEGEPYKFIEPYSHKYSYEFDTEETANSPFESDKNVWNLVNRLRMRVIEEFLKYQEETFKYYDSIKRRVGTQMNADDVKHTIFGNKFCFALNLDRLKHIEYGVFGNQSVFNMFVLVLDFYVSPEEIDLLK